VFAALSMVGGACSVFLHANELSNGDGDDAGSESDTPTTDAPDEPANLPYLATILADKPIAYYRFAEQAGTDAIDQTGQHSATYRGPVTLNVLPGALLSEVEPAIHPGSTDASCVAVGASIDFPERRPFSAEIWVKFDSFDGSYRHLITKNKLDAAGGRQAFGIYVHDREISFERYIAGNVIAVAGGTVDAGTYVHIVGTYDGAQIAIYINGKLKGALADSRPALPSDGDLNIGCTVFPSGIYSTLGVLDEAAIYKTALPPERVNAHYRASGR
jgi:hypothetical protein